MISAKCFTRNNGCARIAGWQEAANSKKESKGDDRNKAKKNEVR